MYLTSLWITRLFFLEQILIENFFISPLFLSLCFIKFSKGYFLSDFVLDKLNSVDVIHEKSIINATVYVIANCRWLLFLYQIIQINKRLALLLSWDLFQNECLLGIRNAFKEYILLPNLSRECGFHPKILFERLLLDLLLSQGSLNTAYRNLD